MSEQAASAASYRRILKSSSIIGGASVINILIGLVRTKILAVLLGPTGVGLVSLFRSLMTTGTTVSTLGLDIVGARQVAEANEAQNYRQLALARRALLWATLALAVVGGIVMWVLRAPLAARVLGDPADSAIVGWLALGVAIGVSAASLGATIQGMRRVGDIARATVYGSVFNTIVGIFAIWYWGNAALVYFVLLVPLGSFLFGWIYVSRLPRTESQPIRWRDMTGQWKMLFQVGFAFMAAALATQVIQLWIRVDVSKVLGTEALGQFQASYTITTQYLTLVLTAMATDYYPRLTGVMRDHTAATRLVNDQTEIALLLGAPILLAMMGLAPWVLRLLYTKDFAPAVLILRWQVLADVLKLASWPLGFILLAAGDGKTFFWTEAASLLVMGGIIDGLLHPFGLEITGVAYLACYVFYLPLIHWLAKRRIGFAWTAPVERLLTVTFIACAIVGLIAAKTRWGVPVGCVSAAVYGTYALGRVSHMSELTGPAGKVGAWARRLTTRGKKP